jgi:endonuclease/exonuclease/phosphatase family metal-dependent hydrolase
LSLNGGRGPDILAIVEVESPRAAELLAQALNERLADPALHYTHVLMKELSAGRHIAPAILTRLPVKAGRTRLHGSHLRILESHIDVMDHDLVILASHWTSRLTDKEGAQRAKYADQIYGSFRAMYQSNPRVDLLICGDFNDPPEAPSVIEHLRAAGNVADELPPVNGPRLLDLMADRDPIEYGTHYFHGRFRIFDQIAVSPGMLDEEGWSCEVESIRTVNTLSRPGDRRRRPWRFGNGHDQAPRGTSDHFPITVQLQVH